MLRTKFKALCMVESTQLSHATPVLLISCQVHIYILYICLGKKLRCLMILKVRSHDSPEPRQSSLKPDLFLPNEWLAVCGASQPSTRPQRPHGHSLCFILNYLWWMLDVRLSGESACLACPGPGVSHSALHKTSVMAPTGCPIIHGAAGWGERRP